MKNRWLSQYIMRIRKWFSEQKAQRMSTKQNAIFWSLTPKDDLDLHIYEQAIDYAFEKQHTGLPRMQKTLAMPPCTELNC